MKHKGYKKFVISLSQHINETEVFKKATGDIHKYIIYDEKNKNWTEELLCFMQSILPTFNNEVLHRNYLYDLAVICALPEELEYVKQSLIDVKQIKARFDDFIYFEGYYLRNDKKVMVIATGAMHMGMVAASTLTTKLI